MMIDSKFFIICFFVIIVFCESEELFEIKSNDTLKGLTKHPFSDYLGSCDRSYDCWGDHRVCVDYICRCIANYKYNYVTKKCKHFYCYSDFDCQEYDFKRYCSNNSCNCVDGYAENSTNGNKCEDIVTFTEFVAGISSTIVIFIVIPILVVIIWRCKAIRRRNLLAPRTANPQPVALITHTDNSQPVALITHTDNSQPVALITHTDNSQPVALITHTDNSQPVALITHTDNSQPVALITHTDDSQPVALITHTDNSQPDTIFANTDNGTTTYQANYFPACYPQNFDDPPPPYSTLFNNELKGEYK
jgi:hypothetical protein